MLILFANARRETEDDENGDYQRGREKLIEWDAQRVTSIYKYIIYIITLIHTYTHKYF